MSVVLKEGSNVVVVSSINSRNIEIYFKRTSNKQNGDWNQESKGQLLHKRLEHNLKVQKQH